MVYTVDLPESRANLKAQVETWASKCDGFWAASNITDHSLGSIDLLHKGPEEYGNMWQKIRSMWAYAYDHYLDEYDYFHIAGDDVYIAVENLRAFLDGPYVNQLENGYLDEISSDPQYIKEAKKWLDGGDYRNQYGISSRPLYFGNPCFWKNKVWPCGGPGYTMNRAALEVFGKLKLQSCNADFSDSREDLFMGSCFEQIGIKISHVFDHDSGSRFLENLSRKPGAPVNKGGMNFGTGSEKIAEKYNLIPKTFLDGISEEAISFHLKISKLDHSPGTIAELIYRYHALLYNLCSR